MVHVRCPKIDQNHYAHTSSFAHHNTFDKNPLTTFDNTNKITNKGISSLSKLRKTLNPFQHKDDASKTQKNFNIAK
jgi:hypothetical protein